VYCSLTHVSFFTFTFCSFIFFVQLSTVFYIFPFVTLVLPGLDIYMLNSLPVFCCPLHHHPHARRSTSSTSTVSFAVYLSNRSSFLQNRP
jgi:hypothetical protein